jgi:hypothetical protein
VQQEAMTATGDEVENDMIKHMNEIFKNHTSILSKLLPVQDFPA